MKMRFLALLAVLPLAALCQDDTTPIPDAETTMDPNVNHYVFPPEYIEHMDKPCVFDGICPTNISFRVDAAKDIMNVVSKFKKMADCSCDLETEPCARSCYYAQTVYIIMALAPWKLHEKASTPEESKRKWLTDYLVPIAKPCITKGDEVRCNQLKLIRNSMDFNRIKNDLKSYALLFSMHEDCRCSLNTDNCARNCFYSVFKNNIIPPGPAEYVAWLLYAAFEPPVPQRSS